MTLLSICRSVAGASGFAVPSTVIGNSDNTAVMLLALINKAGKQRAKWPWEILQKEYTFSTVAATASYAFPTDLGFFLDETIWNRTQYWNLRGSLMPSNWQVFKSGIQTTTPRQRFRVKAGLIYLDPTPTAIESMVIEYVSSKWVTDGAAFFTSFTADTQTSLIDEDLLELDLTWRFLERKGLAYAEARDECDRYAEKISGQDVPRGSLNFGEDSSPWPPLPAVPVTGIGV